MTPARDPRVDPKPGDEISREFTTALGGCVLRKVEDVRGGGGFVFFTRDNGYIRKGSCVHIEEWRKWAKNAEVIHAAD